MKRLAETIDGCRWGHLGNPTLDWLAARWGVAQEAPSALQVSGRCEGAQ